jgi:hypothetical protein
VRRHGPCCSVAKVPGGDGWGGVEARLGRGWGDAASGCRNQFRSTPPVRTPAESPAILRECIGGSPASGWLVAGPPWPQRENSTVRLWVSCRPSGLFDDARVVAQRDLGATSKSWNVSGMSTKCKTPPAVDCSRRFAIAAVAVASFVACWSGGAFGAEMPKELWGNWCSGEDAPDNTYVKCKEGSREQISIDRKSVSFPGADSGCFPIKVRKRKDGAVTWLIRQRCIADDMSRSVWIANYTRDGDYLYYNAVEAP